MDCQPDCKIISVWKLEKPRAVKMMEKKKEKLTDYRLSSIASGDSSVSYKIGRSYCLPRLPGHTEFAERA
jgi:hypothetical protein